MNIGVSALKRMGGASIKAVSLTDGALKASTHLTYWA